LDLSFAPGQKLRWTELETARRTSCVKSAAPATIEHLNERPPDALARRHHPSEALALSESC
jgi:hypothetical protein